MTILGAGNMGVNKDRHDRDACQLVLSDIHHTRHSPRPHFLKRPGLSLLIDLDRLEQAAQQSWFFSVGRLNLLSFYPSDYGCFHKSAKQMEKADDLASYIRSLAKDYGVSHPLGRIELLTFPRIMGVSFNPLSVYRCFDQDNQLRLVVYEVHNTFGEAHSYVGICDEKGRASLHETDKIFHVSPFFDVQGQYQLLVSQREDYYRLIIRYRREGKLALTATLRGSITSMTGLSILSSLVKTRQWPMRPWFAIHVEAAKLFFKRLTYFSKPEPPSHPHSLSSAKGPR